MNNKIDELQIRLDIEDAMDYRERRHADWNENYTLYRDKVITNRLTNRQTINIPLMKYGLQTVLKDVDEPPMINLRSLSNSEQKEIYANATLAQNIEEENKLSVRDRLDKVQALLYGRSFKKQNIVDGKWRFEIIDPQDMLVDRYVDPADIDTARYVVQTGIYRPLEVILDNEDYLSDARNKLKSYMISLDDVGDNTVESITLRNQRLLDMGLADALDPETGKTYIELYEYYSKEREDDEECIYLYVVASVGGTYFYLQKKKLEEILGKTEDNYWLSHYPISTWAVDLDRTDFWSDGTADILRQPNKALNTWISQLSENRTLRNFNMHYYDSSNAQFVPQTFSPEPWGWFPMPGNPNDIVKDVVVGDLSESLDEMQFVISIAERAIAASSVQTGDVQGGQVTLGEIQLALTNAQDRNKGMQVYYVDSWIDFTEKYLKMIEGSKEGVDDVEVKTKGRNGRNYYKKTIKFDMWYDKEGYKIEVKTKQDRQTEDANALQKLSAAKQTMPGNQALDAIYKKKLLEFAGLDSNEIKDVMEAEKQDMQMMTMQQGGPMQQDLQNQPMNANIGV